MKSPIHLLVGLLIVVLLAVAGLVVLVRHHYYGVSPQPSSGGPQFTYEQTGGINGTSEVWTITGDGKVVHQGGWDPSRQNDSWTISRGQVANLTRLFDWLDFLHMRSAPWPEDAVTEGTFYTITYTGRGLTNTATAYGGADRFHPFWRCADGLERELRGQPRK